MAATTSSSVSSRPRRAAGPGAVASIMFGVGWGANQFASLLGLYSGRLHLGDGAAQAMFGIYALGLVPGLVLGGPASDRLGRRRIALPFASVSALVTLVLMAGATAPALLYVGRFLAGIVTGAVLATGTAWAKELSPRSGTRLTALAVSAGFGAGPLVASLVAQWAPDPLVTAYVPHLLIMVAAVPLAFRVRETSVRRPKPVEGRGPRLGGVGRARFWQVVAPVAIWTFTAPVTAFAVLPTRVPVRHLPIVYSGVMTALTLAAGMAAQPVARRLEGRHPRLVARTGLAGIISGLVAAALTVGLEQPALNAVAALLLGGGYGFVLNYSLTEVARMARPGELAGLTAAAYALVYVGMFTPLVLTRLDGLVPLDALLATLAVLASACLAYVWRRNATARPEAAERLTECSAGR
ncbi:MFS transporter [Actinomadura sp. NEAU-AAG7]|uniref:MFS transporter n=1 Tax=Actinomadura sp. NEAU-AAG7 TaxID=2839640 RepID=UPI001BE482A1|nr:MFS transporter [Actinomadura sp. NEAU-AAG7]MBT2207601.1 MFS transporter [Actinomadura sp. NEAU-AAG7]